MPEGVKFLYFGRVQISDFYRPKGGRRAHHQGVVTIAWIETSPGTLHLGFSFCSPEDHWCKATGRNMALARLLTPVVVPFLYDAKRTVHEIVRAVITHDFMRIAALTPGATMIWERVPSWTKDLAKRLMGGTESERRGNIKRLTKKLIGGPTPFFPPFSIPVHILARMMADIAKLDKR